MKIDVPQVKARYVNQCLAILAWEYHPEERIYVQLKRGLERLSLDQIATLVMLINDLKRRATRR